MNGNEREARTCWICGEPASSGEHILKKSDIVRIRGAISQKNPVLLTRDYKRYTIGSADNRRTKYGDMLCAHCNSTRSQPFDRAWDRFAAYVSPMTISRDVRRAYTFDIFGENRAEDVNLHLYFAKVLGCALRESSLSTNELSAAILGGFPVTNMRIIFRSLPANRDLFLSPLFAVVHGDTIHSIQCAYDTGTLRCIIVLGNFPAGRQWPSSAWYPRAAPTSVIIWPEHASRVDAKENPPYRLTVR